MVGADFYIFVFTGYAPGDVQFAGVRVEVDGRYADGEGHVHALGAGGTGGGLVDDAADGRGCEKVIRCY